MKLTRKTAKEMPCPLARTMPDSVLKNSKGNCVADLCPVWRWSLMADNRYLSAITREAALMAHEWNETNPNAKRPKTQAMFEKQATTKVTQNLVDYIVLNDEDKGYCGLGGEPHV